MEHETHQSQESAGAAPHRSPSCLWLSISGPEFSLWSQDHQKRNCGIARHGLWARNPGSGPISKKSHHMGPRGDSIRAGFCWALSGLGCDLFGKVFLRHEQRDGFAPQHHVNQVHACRPSTREWRQENQKLRGILSYTRSMRLAWATRDSVSERKTDGHFQSKLS